MVSLVELVNDENKNKIGESINVKVFLISLYFLSCMLPYISIMPLNTDIQPLYALLGLISLAYILIKDQVFVSRATVFFMLFAFIFILNYSFVAENSFIYHIRKSVGVLFVIPVVIIFSKYYHLLKFRIYLIVLTAYFLGALIQALFPAVYYSVFSFIFNNKTVELGLRGWKSFTPEPIDFAITCIMLMLMVFGSYLIAAIKKSQMIFLQAGFLLLMLGTFSATGYICFFVILAVYFLSRIKLSKLVSLTIIILCLQLFAFDYLYDNVRSFQLAVNLITDPLQVIEKTSLFYRVFHNMVAAFYFFDNPSLLGLGVGSFDIAAKYVHDEYDLIRIFPFRSEFISLGYYGDFGAESKNMVSQLVIEHGALGILFYLLCYFMIFSRWVNGFSKFILVTFAVASIQSTPMVFPLLWVLIAINSFLYQRSIKRALDN